MAMNQTSAHAPALEYRGFSFSYPGKAVVENLSWQLPQGSFTVLAGATGSGKTTLLRCAKPGLATGGSASGQVLVDGRPAGELDARSSAQLVGYVAQNPDNQIVCDTVWHQLAFGLENLGTPQEQMRRNVAELSHFLGIGGWFHRQTSELSGGQRQLLNLAGVLATGPRLLLLDEPTSMLDPVAQKDFLHILLRLNRELGITVVCATHAPLAFAPYADSFFLLEQGRLRPLPAGEELPLPQAGPLPPRAQAAGSAQAALELRDVYARYKRGDEFILRGMDLCVAAGSIHAVIGGNGSGKSTLLRCASGLMKPERGRLRNALSARQALLPQDPKVLFVCDSVEEELVEWQQACGYSSDDVASALQRYRLEGTLQQHPYDLSGGQQQLLALAKLELTDPDLLLLDEPTKGLDPAARLQLAQCLAALRAQGCTVLLATHDLSFAACTADEVTLLFDGQAACTQPAGEFFGSTLFYKPAPDSLYQALFQPSGGEQPA